MTIARRKLSENLPQNLALESRRSYSQKDSDRHTSKSKTFRNIFSKKKKFFFSLFNKFLTISELIFSRHKFENLGDIDRQIFTKEKNPIPNRQNYKKFGTQKNSKRKKEIFPNFQKKRTRENFRILRRIRKKKKKRLKFLLQNL